MIERHWNGFDSREGADKLSRAMVWYSVSTQSAGRAAKELNRSGKLRKSKERFCGGGICFDRKAVLSEGMAQLFAERQGKGVDAK